MELLSNSLFTIIQNSLMLCLLHLFANQRLGLEGSHGAAVVQDIRPSTQQLGLTTGHLMLDVPFWQGNLHCCKLQRAATTLQVQSPLLIARKHM